MENVVLTVHLLLAVALIVLVLLQRSEGGGLGMGGGGGGGVMTGRQAANALSRVTWALAIAFLVTSLALTVIAARNASSGSVIDQLDLSRPAMPAPASGNMPAMPAYAPPPAAGQPITPPAPAAPRQPHLLRRHLRLSHRQKLRQKRLPKLRPKHLPKLRQATNLEDPGATCALTQTSGPLRLPEESVISFLP
ncbi:preprotein translocase subunit SecG [Paracoccus cavernae]|uniref:Protein-export membrane protein SecG n=1 Tax=Paracoccus cavernae TaxID=1571207 RepID=A0ABT8D6A5_9RHOB|nr:preprotein translocase subunit SecG [Paracoccus cavernae]